MMWNYNRYVWNYFQTHVIVSTWNKDNWYFYNNSTFFAVQITLHLSQVLHYLTMSTANKDKILWKHLENLVKSVLLQILFLIAHVIALIQVDTETTPRWQILYLKFVSLYFEMYLTNIQDYLLILKINIFWLNGKIKTWSNQKI